MLARFSHQRMSRDCHIPPTLAPCGVYCGACPSFGKSCLGCASEDSNQPRRSKWGCKIRSCCYETKKYDFCVDCPEYPCKIVNTKLFKEHIDDPRFTYRFEIPGLFGKLKTLGIDKYMEFQRSRWTCEKCGGTIRFYDYKCDTCHKESKDFIMLSKMDNTKIFKMPFARVYPLYIQKAEKKGRNKSEVDAIIYWLTGYDEQLLQQQIDRNCDFETFFAQAPCMNPNASKITGVVCGVRVEEIEDELMQKIRYLDKMVDELAKGRAMEKILR